MSADRNRESEKSRRRASLAQCALQNSRQNVLSCGNSGAASARKGEHHIDALGSRPCTPALKFRRADTSRAFSGGWNNAQLRMAHVAFVVVRIVLQRNFHRMVAAFKPQLEGLVGHDAAILNP